MSFAQQRAESCMRLQYMYAMYMRNPNKAQIHV
jgi:hypothetical protein